jgi:hypothetical protein
MGGLVFSRRHGRVQLGAYANAGSGGMNKRAMLCAQQAFPHGVHTLVRTPTPAHWTSQIFLCSLDKSLAGVFQQPDRGGRNMWTQAVQRLMVAVALLGISLWMMPMSVPAVEVGDKAPDFVMHSTVGETVQLSDYQGKKNVLLFFFVAAFTGV